MKKIYRDKTICVCPHQEEAEIYKKALDKISKIMAWYKGPRVSQGTECAKIAKEALDEEHGRPS